MYLALFKSYFTEKGKNLATKEDVEDITKKVESIKTEFIKETEKLKHELQFENQIKISFTNDLKNSIVEVYDDYNNWHNIIYNSFLDSLDFSLKHIDKADMEMDKAYLKFETAVSKLELYIKNDRLDEILKRILDANYNFQEMVQDYWEDLSEIVDDEEQNVEFSQKLDNEKLELYNKTSEKISRESSKVLNIQEELRDIFHELLTEKIKK
jgi:hypothetical protein